MTKGSMRWVALSLAGALVIAATTVLGAQGWRPRTDRTALDGYQEVPTLSTTGKGTLRLAISHDRKSVRYVLRYNNLEGNVTQAHIHIGRPGVNGGIMVWLCATPPLSPPMSAPAAPLCPEPGEPVSGELTPDHVVGPVGQGVAPGHFNRFLDALRAGAAYANVHTTLYPPGEIRGDIEPHVHDVRFR